MANVWGAKSLEIWGTLHPKLQELFDEVLKHFDCALTTGYRNAEDQNRAFEKRLSKLRWPDSKHNKLPSEAVDVYPVPISWGEKDRMVYFAGVVMGIAAMKEIKIRWGADWDRDKKPLEDDEFDLGHFELDFG